MKKINKIFKKWDLFWITFMGLISLLIFVGFIIGLVHYIVKQIF